MRLTVVALATVAVALFGCGGGSGGDAPETVVVPPGAIDITAEGVVFSTDALSASAGEITIAFDNQDSGIVHNIHVREGRRPNGPSIARTELETGRRLQLLTLTLEAGDYYYLCDAHPNMNGILSVE